MNAEVAENAPRTGARLHCLGCFATLPASGAACPACGRLDVPGERRVFWNRAPRLVGLQRVLRLLVFPAVYGLYWILESVPVSERPSGVLVFLPLLVGFLLWKTVGKLTRREPYFAATVFWCAGLLLAAGGMLLGGHPVEAASCAAAAAIVAVSGRLLSAWRRRLLDPPDKAKS